MIKKLWLLGLVSLLLFVSINVYAAEEDTRYFVKSNTSFWKKSFNARHSFDDGFTADLNDWQIKVAKLFGVEIEPVKKLSILDLQGILGKVRPTPRPTPTESVDWGVKMIYDDLELAKTNGGIGVSVAVLDTGIVKHPDLKNRIKQCKDFSGIKPIIDGKCEDKNGHGTHVAGIIAADGGDDAKGIYGVAPESDIFAYKVCSNSGSCWADDISIAIRAAADSGANIINLSLGSDNRSGLITNAIAYAVSKQVLVVAAAGNDGPYQGSIDYPAADANVVAAGAIDSSVTAPDWSSRGINSLTKPYVVEEKDIEFGAPGVSVESTWKDGGYVVLSGTSMAAPHISGLAAKVWQKDSDKPAEATREFLHFLSKDITPPGDDDMTGWGLPQL